MIKKLLIWGLSLTLLLAAASATLAVSAGTAAAGQRYWSSSEAVLAYQDQDTKLTLTKGDQSTTLAQSAGGLIVDFYVSGEYAVYYAPNAQGKLKWFTYNMNTGARKEYAFNHLAPFWADSDGVYSTTGGKRVYDYNVFRFDPKTGKKTKLAAVYGMPIGYIGAQLIALDFYHDELRYYEGNKVVKKVGADMRSGFIVNETVYLILDGGVYRVDGANLTKVIERYMGVQACFNGSAFLYHSGGDYPREAYLATPAGIQKVGTAKDEAALSALRGKAIELSREHT